MSSVLVSFVLVLRAWGCGRSSKRENLDDCQPIRSPTTIPIQKVTVQSSVLSYPKTKDILLTSVNWNFLAILSFLYNESVRRNQFNSCLQEAPKIFRFQCLQYLDSPAPCCQDRQRHNTCSSLFHLSSLGSKKMTYNDMTIGH